MSNIRRLDVENHPVFITCVCQDRDPFLKTSEEKNQLLSVMRHVKLLYPYKMLGYVILDDHFHWLIDINQSKLISKIMQSIKLRFSHYYKNRYDIKQHTSLWQNRFWDHVIRDENDLHNHLDYMHYNPVKHGYTHEPSQYAWSSFQYYLNKDFYQPEWGVVLKPSSIKDLVCE